VKGQIDLKIWDMVKRHIIPYDHHLVRDEAVRGRGKLHKLEYLQMGKELWRNTEVAKGLEEIAERAKKDNRIEGVLAAMPPDPEHDVTAAGGYATYSRNEILRARYRQIIKKYQRHPLDTGSSEIQVVIMTEKNKFNEMALQHPPQRFALAKGL